MGAKSGHLQLGPAAAAARKICPLDARIPPLTTHCLSTQATLNPLTQTACMQFLIHSLQITTPLYPERTSLAFALTHALHYDLSLRIRGSCPLLFSIPGRVILVLFDKATLAFRVSEHFLSVTEKHNSHVCYENLQPTTKPKDFSTQLFFFSISPPGKHCHHRELPPLSSRPV